MSSLHAQNKELIDKVVAYVGSELVLLSEVEEQYALMKERNPEMPEEQKCAILENLMVQKLLVNQAKLDSVVVLDEEVDVQLNARIDRILSMMNNDISQFEDYYGKSISQVKAQFREDLKSQILAERMQGRATEGMAITPAQVKEFFYSVPNDSLPFFGAEVEVAEIIAKPKVNRVEHARSYDKLEKLKKRIEKGEDFGELATKFSDDPGSGQQGGELGWMKRGTLVPEYEAAAYNLEKGEISEIIESEYGLHLIQLIERRGNSINTRHILIKPEITEEDFELSKEYLDSVRHAIASDSIDFTQGVQMFSDKKSFSYNNGGRLTNPKTGNTFFEIGDLDPDIYFTIDTMEVGQISQPIPFLTPQGEKQFRIIQVTSYTDPHRANLKNDYYKIQKAATEQRKNIQFYDWITSKIEKTYVKVEKPFLQCPNMASWLNTDNEGL